MGETMFGKICNRTSRLALAPRARGYHGRCTARASTLTTSSMMRTKAL